MIFAILAALLIAGVLVWRLGLVKKALARPAKPQDPSQYDAWQVGPMVRGENRSPRSVKVRHPGAIFAVEIPHGIVGDKIGELSGVTYVNGPLTGSRIKARFRIEAKDGVEMVTSQHTSTTSIVAFFQRYGDNWSAIGEYEDDRWYSKPHAITPLKVNTTYELNVPLALADWGSTQSDRHNPSGFADAKAHAERVGLVMGGGDGYGHGLYATGPARFVLEAFSVE